MRHLIWFHASAVFFVFLAVASSSALASETQQWGVWETSLEGPSTGNPFVDVALSATFHCRDQQITTAGFYDGDGVYKIRFSPPTQGQWSYATQSNIAKLNDLHGSFTAGPPSQDNHGGVEVFDTFYFRYADGTPYHQFGTTCYAWTHQTEALQEQTLQTLSGSPFNKIRFCVFPKSYTYNQNDPDRYAFQKATDGEFDFSRFDPAFWQHFEQRIVDLQRLGIQADVILWHPYDRWGFAEMSDPQDDRYLRYCIARLLAYRNVWWSLANEFDLMTDPPSGHRGNKTMDDWDRFFKIVQAEDPYHRLLGIHNGREWYDHTQPWVTHASVQSTDMAAGIEYRNRYQKPVIYDECQYEGDIPHGWGNLTPEQITRRFWLGTMNGCYVGHSETYLHPDDILWWAKGGELHGQSAERIAWLKQFMADAPPMNELQPLGDGQGRYLLAKPNEYYLLYLANSQPQTIDLPGDQSYKVDMIDPWKMEVLPCGSAEQGEHTIEAGLTDLAFRFTPYADGETRRPDESISIKPANQSNDDLTPRAWTFRSDSDAKSLLWDFGDGTTSAQNPVSHAFEKPGIYRVMLRITDRDGRTSVRFARIGVDRNQGRPLLRAGFSSNESPNLELVGAATRGEQDAIELPAGPPWSYVTSGPQVQEDLGGLVAFTIAGWLKPSSLEVGSGGNRIVYCLNEKHSGIDLVSRADGRLRLAVNQWPDRIQNDSSAGKLIVGKWTCFVVTYDSTKDQQSVAWYFSEALDVPENPIVRLDRVNDYNVGPIANQVGPLAIGNFNQTMKDYGMDRQFRGQIRGLEIFGSRMSADAAMDESQIRKLVEEQADD